MEIIYHNLKNRWWLKCS